MTALTAVLNHNVERFEFYRDRIYGRLANLLQSDSPEAVRATHASMDDATYNALVETVRQSDWPERARAGLVLPEGASSRIAPGPKPKPARFAPHNDPQRVDPDLLELSEFGDHSSDEDSD